ncbi:hypothetical protein scyTo_0025917, partial [Scyliorhinus torazame]|nr:hypothetical protein [Scyliorhinus torazame]
MESTGTTLEPEPGHNVTETPSKHDVFSHMKNKFMNELSKIP